LRGGAEGTAEKNKAGYPASGPRFEYEAEERRSILEVDGRTISKLNREMRSI
jgi:hypothetical protein